MASARNVSGILRAQNAAKPARTADIMIGTVMVTLTAAGTAIAMVIWTGIGIGTVMDGWTAGSTAMTMNALTVVTTGTATAG